MNANKSVTAYFVAITYTLTTATSGSGTVTKNPNAASYASGTQVALTATPAAGYLFDHWGGDASGTTSPVTVTMNANKSVTAYFVSQTTYDLAASVSPAGTGTVSPASGTYNGGMSVTLTATPAAGHRFDHWGGDAAGSDNPLTITISGDTSVVAYFAAAHFTGPAPQADFLTAQGTIEAAEVAAAPGDEIAVFDPDGVCCGTFCVTQAGVYGPIRINLDNPATAQDEGVEDGDRLVFMVWDASTDLETAAHLEMVSQDGDDYEVNLAGHYEETIPLRAGWNLVSFTTNVCYYTGAQPPEVEMLEGVAYQQVADLNDALSSIDNRYEVVRGFDAEGAHTYDPAAAPAMNDLGYLAPGYGYWIKATEDCELTLSGGRVSPLARLQLASGWNLVGFWGHEVNYLAVEPDALFAGPPETPVLSEVAAAADLFPAIAGLYQVINSFDADGAHSLRPDLPDFVSDLRYAGPGYGFWVRMNGNGQLSY
jgi:hypothetical protein